MTTWTTSPTPQKALTSLDGERDAAGLTRTITERRFAAAIDDLADLAVDRYPTLPLMRRAYELRANLTAYDAAYVALAEGLDCALLTADARLAGASGPRCAIKLLAGA